MSEERDTTALPDLDVFEAIATVKRLYDVIYRIEFMLAGRTDYRVAGPYRDVCALLKYLEVKAIPARSATRAGHLAKLPRLPT